MGSASESERESEKKNTYPDLGGRHAVVGVVDEQVDADRATLAQLARREQAHAAEQLELAALEHGRLGGEEPVEQVDREREDLLLAVLLLANLSAGEMNGFKWADVACTLSLGGCLYPPRASLAVS